MSKLPLKLPKATKLAILALESRLGRRIFRLDDEVSTLKDEIRILKSNHKLKVNPTNTMRMVETMRDHLTDYVKVLSSISFGTEETRVKVKAVIEQANEWLHEEDPYND